MRFYVIARYEEQKNEDLVLDLENMTFNKIRIDDEIEEDKTYVSANGQVIEIKNIDFNLKNLYLEAFSKSRKIRRDEFKFLKINRSSNVYINDNYFLFNGEKLIGRIINSKEKEEVINKGVEKFNKLFKKLLLNDMVVLVKGKKIYRIFTYAKLNSLMNENDQIDMFEFVNKSYTSEILVKLKEKIDAAYKNLEEAKHRMDEELNRNNER